MRRSWHRFRRRLHQGTGWDALSGAGGAGALPGSLWPNALAASRWAFGGSELHPVTRVMPTTRQPSRTKWSQRAVAARAHPSWVYSRQVMWIEDVYQAQDTRNEGRRQSAGNGSSRRGWFAERKDFSDVDKWIFPSDTSPFSPGAPPLASRRYNADVCTDPRTEGGSSCWSTL